MSEPSPRARRLRVVFLDHVARLSGGEIALLRLLPALTEHVDVHVILGEDGPLVERLGQAGIAVEVLPINPRLRDLRKETLEPAEFDLKALASLPSYVGRLSRRIRAIDPDIVHTNSLKAAFYGGLAARVARVSPVWHVRDRIAADYLPGSAVLLVRATSRLLATAVIANSQETRNSFPGSRKIEVLYDPVEKRPDVQPRPRENSAPTIGVVGRLSPWKGQDVFLSAFAQAFKDTPARARIIGSPLFGEASYAESLESLASELGISPQVEFLGFREDVWAELNQLDVLVHCSVLPEPFGQVVLEGMAAGVAVVASAAGGPTELITDGVNGILTTPGDSAELASVLQRLVADPKLRAALGARGQARSRAFTPTRVALELLEIYTRMTVRSR